MPQQPSRQGGSNRGGAIGEFFAFLLVLAIVGGGIYFILYNNIRSIEDAKAYFGTATTNIAECREKGISPKDCAKSVFNEGNNTSINPEEADNRIERLNNIPLSEANNASLDKASYKHWVKIQGECDTRETILIQQGKSVQVNDKCKPISGEWTDQYTGNTIPDSNSVMIDHIVPIEYVNNHGGAEWDEAKKESFANDLQNLATTSIEESNNKLSSGYDISSYKPSRQEYTCYYASTWVDMAEKYGFSITVNDRDAIKSGLNFC